MGRGSTTKAMHAPVSIGSIGASHVKKNLLVILTWPLSEVCIELEKLPRRRRPAKTGTYVEMCLFGENWFGDLCSQGAPEKMTLDSCLLCLAGVRLIQGYSSTNNIGEPGFNFCDTTSLWPIHPCRRGNMLVDYIWKCVVSRQGFVVRFSFQSSVDC